MPLRLYNTLSRSQELFTPIRGDDGPVTFYSCGPTVYDYAHIGNFRSFLNADILRRTLEMIGYRVEHVMNITDVGHMTEDDDVDGGGEDKMQVASKRILEDKKSGKIPDGSDIDPSDPRAIADYYAQAFLDDGTTLGLQVAVEADRFPERLPRPTAYIQGMIELIEGLIESKHAYVADDGVVYFDVGSFPEYGALSGNTVEALRSGEGGRVLESNQVNKRSPADFMLWKPDPKHLMRWDSPWGEGYPGWHLECSVMAEALLGHNGEIDIHSGGEDNIFPHHECEIAQSRCATGSSSFARYWFHTRHLVVEGEKMSKSKGNFFTVRDILEKGVTPGALRLELVRTHYRQNANFTMQGLKDCTRMVDRWCRLRDQLAGGMISESGAEAPLHAALPRFTECLCDDLNLARAIGVLNEASALARVNQGEGVSDPELAASELAALMKMNHVLGVLERNESISSEEDDDLLVRVEALIAARADAKARKDWSAADGIRDELIALGISIKDGPEGTTWSRNVE